VNDEQSQGSGGDSSGGKAPTVAQNQGGESGGDQGDQPTGGWQHEDLGSTSMKGGVNPTRIEARDSARDKK
jgi:hypothetical protein